MVIFSSGLERVSIARRFPSVSENHGSVLVNLLISSKKEPGTQKAAVLLGSAFCQSAEYFYAQSRDRALKGWKKANHMITVIVMCKRYKLELHRKAMRVR